MFEDGQLQTVTQFTNERVPVSLGRAARHQRQHVRQPHQDARAAIERFLVELLEPDDEFFILAFNHRRSCSRGGPATARRRAQRQRPARAHRVHGDLRCDRAALPLVERRTRQRAALLVISDGADTASDVTLRDVRSALLRSDTFVYAIAIDRAERRRDQHARQPDGAARKSPTRAAAAPKSCTTAARLATALADIAEELNSQYLIGYTSPKAARRTVPQHPRASPRHRAPRSRSERVCRSSQTATLRELSTISYGEERAKHDNAREETAPGQPSVQLDAIRLKADPTSGEGGPTGIE